MVFPRRERGIREDAFVHGALRGAAQQKHCRQLHAMGDGKQKASGDGE